MITFHKQLARLRAAILVMGGAALLAGLALPSGPFIVVVAAVPLFWFVMWRIKCPHCGERLLSSGAAYLEWEKVGAVTWRPSRCRKCRGSLRRQR